MTTLTMAELAGIEESELHVDEEEVTIGEADMVEAAVGDETHLIPVADDDNVLTVLEDDSQINLKLNPAPTYQNLIIQHMDIAEPLITLKNLLEMRLQCSLGAHEFYLTDTLPLDASKSLVDQCVQGDGMVQVNLEIKSHPGTKPKINIVDVLKPADEVEAVMEATEEETAPQPPAPRLPARKPRKPPPQQVTRWIVDQAYRREQEHLGIPFEPTQWTESHVLNWIQWGIKEFNLINVNISQFNFDGAHLCGLTHPDFVKLIPVDPGDVFWTHLELLRKCKFVAVIQQAPPTIICKDNGARVKQRQKLRPMKMLGENRMTGPGNRTGNNGQIQLWQFLLELLTDKDCQEIIQWVGDNGEFKLLNPEVVATLWGQRKNKPTMNYEKLSRALRYYYDGDMISKVHGKRFMYRYVCDLQTLIGYTAAEMRRLVTECAVKKTLKDRSQVWSHGVLKIVKAEPSL